MGINKKQAVEIAIREAKIYKDKLVNTKILIIYRDKQDNQIKDIEIEFRPDKFQHLTGLILTQIDSKTGKRFPRKHTALEFYNRCIKKPFITEQEIAFKDEKTIDLKLLALPYITQITKITKMSGTFNHSKPKLEADYIIGGIKSCIGISKYENRDTYYPRSCLCEDIRNITTYSSPVLAIFQIPLSNNETIYKKICYVSKGLNLHSLNFPINIANKISLENYNPPINTTSKQKFNKKLITFEDKNTINNSLEITDDRLDR